MEKVKAALAKILGLLRVLLGILPKRILMALAGMLLAGVARKFPGIPLPSPGELLAISGILIGADSLRELGSGKALVEVKSAPAGTMEALEKGLEDVKK